MQDSHRLFEGYELSALMKERIQLLEKNKKLTQQNARLSSRGFVGTQETIIKKLQEQTVKQKRRIAELEAQIKHKDEVMLKQTKLNTRIINEKMALVDGLRSKCDQWWRTEDPLARIIAREVRTLLDKEKDDE